jgi:hypothetical protein
MDRELSIVGRTGSPAIWNWFFFFVSPSSAVVAEDNDDVAGSGAGWLTSRESLYR